MPGDAGFGERLLCVAQAINEAALREQEKVSRFNQALLLGEPAAIRLKTD